MTTFRPVENRVIPQAIADTSTTKKLPLGTIIKARDADYGEGEFIYLLGLADTAVGTVVTYNPQDFSTTLLVANAVGPVAVSMSANVASQYGWYQISGRAIAYAAAAVADNANLYSPSASMAGKVDDIDVAGDYIYNAKAGEAATEAGLFDIEIARPFVNDGLDN